MFCISKWQERQLSNYHGPSTSPRTNRATESTNTRMCQKLKIIRHDTTII